MLDLADIPVKTSVETSTKNMSLDEKLGLPKFYPSILLSFYINRDTNKERKKATEKLGGPNSLADIKLPWKKNGNRRPQPEDFHPPKESNKSVTSETFISENGNSARNLFNYWNSFDSTITHREGTDIGKGSLFLLEDKILKQFTTEEVKKLIEDYAGNRHRTHRRKKPLSLDKFLLKIFKDKFGKEYPKNYKQVFAELKRLYLKHAVCESDINFTKKQRSQLELAARKVCCYVEKGRLNKYIESADYKTYCLHLFQALAMRYNSSTEIMVGHLCSNYTWNDVFPRYISREFTDGSKAR